MISYRELLSYENVIYKELYEDGLRNRDRLNGKFAPTITILSTETVGVLWLVFELINAVKANNGMVNMEHLCNFTFLVLSIIPLIAAILYFWLCFTNYNFLYPRPEKVKTFIDENKECIGEYKVDEVFDNILSRLSQDYAAIAISNDKETNRHNDFLNKSYICIMATLIFMTIDFISLTM